MSTEMSTEGYLMSSEGSLMPTEGSLMSTEGSLCVVDCRYLKTSLFGMTCLLPDYSLLCVCADSGTGPPLGPGLGSREHLAVAMALEVPVAVVITKLDLVGKGGRGTGTTFFFRKGGHYIWGGGWCVWGGGHNRLEGGWGG